MYKNALKEDLIRVVEDLDDSPLVSMKKEKRDVPLRTAYSQAGRLWNAAKAKQSSRAGAAK
ncbi:hypothetical protein TNCV_5118011 [Trichonephila clavipes]|nr:hypothetical protein TNCV_5118011 [Trichonephila clavipes]